MTWTHSVCPAAEVDILALSRSCRVGDVSGGGCMTSGRVEGSMEVVCAARVARPCLSVLAGDALIATLKTVHGYVI